MMAPDYIRHCIHANSRTALAADFRTVG